MSQRRNGRPSCTELDLIKLRLSVLPLRTQFWHANTLMTLPINRQIESTVLSALPLICTLQALNRKPHVRRATSCDATWALAEKGRS